MKIYFAIREERDVFTIKSVVQNYNRTEKTLVGYYDFRKIQEFSSSLCTDARRKMTEDPANVPEEMLMFSRGDKLPEKGTVFKTADTLWYGFDVGGAINAMRVRHWFDVYSPFLVIYEGIPPDATAFMFERPINIIYKNSLQYKDPTTSASCTKTSSKILIGV